MVLRWNEDKERKMSLNKYGVGYFRHFKWSADAMPVTGPGRFVVIIVVVVAFYVHFPSVCFGYSRSSSLVTRIKIDGNT